MERVGQRVKVFPTASDLESFVGTAGVIDKELGDDERDEEVGRMFYVTLDTGERLTVFEDEIETL